MLKGSFMHPAIVTGRSLQRQETRYWRGGDAYITYRQSEREALVWLGSR